MNTSNKKAGASAVAAVIAAALCVLSGCGLRVDVPDVTAAAAERTPTSVNGDRTPVSTNTDDVVAQLNSLPVKGRAPKTGYSRSQFGRAWTDKVDVQFGGNGCLQSDDILRTTLTSKVMRAGNRCIVESGVLNPDPYTGQVIPYKRGSRPASISIDHIVALGDGWQKGAQQWSLQKRTEFANDPRNLVVVSASQNSAKKDSDFATWEPPNKAYRCTYATRIVEVKHAYGLWVTAAERNALTRTLSNC